MIDESVLAQVFEGLLSGNMSRIKDSQNFISSNCLQQNYCVSLMRLGANPAFSQNIRLSAVANLKNTVETFWNPNQQNQGLQENEKAVLRESVLDALIRSILDDSQIVKIYKQVIGFIVQSDYPAVWPSFLDVVIARLSPSQNAAEIQGCLLTLERVFQKYELEIDNRTVLDHILTKSIVVLQNLAGQMVANYSESVAPLLKSLLKIYYRSINIAFPLILAEPSTFQSWMIILKLIISFQIPPEVQALDRPDQHPFWKNKKWAFKSIIKILNKYCFKNTPDKISQAIYQQFLHKYSVSFVESVAEVLFNQYQKGQYVSNIVLNSSLLFVFYSLPHDETFNALHSILEKLILDVCVPMLSTTPEDLNIYNNDPQDYIRKDEDTSISINKNAAVLIIKEVCKLLNPQKESYLEYALSLVVNCLTNGVNPRTNQSISIAQKEGIFYLLGIIRDQVQLVIPVDSMFVLTPDMFVILKVYEQKNLTDKLEEIVASFITRELGSDVGILKARTCWLLGRYGGLNFLNANNLNAIITGLSQCMIGGDLVVRVKASIALQYYIDQDGVRDLVRPGLQDMLSIYIKLMVVIDNENLVSALECIVENFTAEIQPFAYDLANHLTLAFYRYKDKDVDEDQACEDGELPAAGCLQAIRQIMESALEPSIYAKMENDFLLKLIIDCLTEKDYHYIEEGFGLLNMLLFNSQTISNNLWVFYPFICYSIIGFPSSVLNVNSLQSPEHRQLFTILANSNNYGRKQWIEALDSMIGPMKNYFQKGVNVILFEKDLFGQNLIELLLETVKITYTNSNEFNEVDQMLATSLLIGFVENMTAPSIDSILPNILIDSVRRINETKCKPVKVVNIEVIALGLYYNPFLTLSTLESLNYVGSFFREYFDLLSYFKTDFDKQRMMFGIASIFTLQQSQLPQTILDSLEGLGQYLVKLSIEIVQLREQGDKEKDDEDELAEEEVQKFHQQLQQMQFADGNNQPNEDEDDEEDEDFEENVEFKSKVSPLYTSPLELQDELLYLEKVLSGLSQIDSGLYSKLVSSLNAQDTSSLQTCFGYAKNQLLQQQQLQQQQQQQQQS